MRVVVRVLTALLGMALATVGVLVLAELVWAWARPSADGLVMPRQVTAGVLSRTAWSDPPVRIAAAVAGALGLVLLLAGLRARRRILRLHDPAPQITATTSPRSLARAVGHRVREQEGIVSATVTASRRRIRVRATANSSAVGTLRETLTELTAEALGELPLRVQPRVAVSVTPNRERS